MRWLSEGTNEEKIWVIDNTRTENYLYKQRVWLNSEEMDWQEYNISKKQAKEILNNKNINIEEKVNYYD